ncbi:MAG: hypothetical protein ACLFT6_08950, partial [Bacteroidales bacterium]
NPPKQFPEMEINCRQVLINDLLPSSSSPYPPRSKLLSFSSFSPLLVSCSLPLASHYLLLALFI